jgi:leucyl-tRNA synthetase
MMELVNAIYQSVADKEVFVQLLIMLSPIAPHFCEELWQSLGNKDSISCVSWPNYDPKMLVEETVTMVVQINGKVRSHITTPTNAAVEAVQEIVAKDEKSQQWIQGKPHKKFIIVPNKLVNIVV